MKKWRAGIGMLKMSDHHLKKRATQNWVVVKLNGQLSSGPHGFAQCQQKTAESDVHNPTRHIAAGQPQGS